MSTRSLFRFAFTVLALSLCGSVRAQWEAVRVRTKVQGGGFHARVGWQRGGKWRHFALVSALSFGKPDERGWRTGRAVVTVPENVETLVLLFNVNQEVGEVCWVDDAEIVRVE